MSAIQPKDAAAVILLRQNTDPNNPEVFWVKRSPKLVFLGGFYAFPGGQAEPTDAEAPIENSDGDRERAAMISCAAREMFEETGVLLARGTETLTAGQRSSLLDDLESKRMTWPELITHYGLRLNVDDFTFVGRWVTPPFAPRRFDTWFFLVKCPAKQEPMECGNSLPLSSNLKSADESARSKELESGEWVSAREAYEKWERDEVLAAPPVLHALKTLAGGLTDDLVERFLSVPEAHRQVTQRMEFRRNYICFPVRTPTKPPATHTNAYLLYTSREVLIVDPGSPYEEEQRALAECVDDLIGEGRAVREIALTHAHPDHVAGVNALNDHLKARHGVRVPVAAHRLTAESLKHLFDVDRYIEDNEVISLDGEPSITLQALFTPGHARGHLCFYDEARGVLISGDNVVGFGSVLIDPADGNMSEYLHSLRRMRSLANVTVLLPGHGPAVAHPYDKIDQYIAHRLEREANILRAVHEGASTAAEIVARVYTDVNPKAVPMAERAVLAHLVKLVTDGLVTSGVSGNFRACQNPDASG
jgi:glyoxylase-like metal-dependent hydrolase (beta-lactamase superfamily II)/8-oxo-dGTP pyrophosphatase MutT (NUDIX family)